MRTITIAAFLTAASLSSSDGAAFGREPAASQLARQRPPRERPAPRAGTAQLGGRVTAADSGAPLRDVHVALFAPAELGGRRSARTDASGHYAFAGLPAGRYRLEASKPGFVALRYGASDPLEPVVEIQLVDGQVVSNANFALPRAAVISGRIVDEYGEPAPDVEVRALRHQMVGGQRRLATASRVRQTDDLGAFRIFGLLPGTYYVSALPRAGDRPTEGEDAVAYVATYFPGTADPSAAERVIVRLGEEAANISFGLVQARAIRLTGVVADSAGQPAVGARVTAVRSEGTRGFVTSAETRTDREGRFVLHNLAPGTYSVQAWVSFPAAEARDPEFGAVTAQAAEGAVEDIRVTAKKGSALQGRVTLRNQGGAKLFKPSFVEISARPASQDVRFPAGRGASARVKADWTFQLDGLSGPRMIRVAGVPSPWSLEAILFDGEDITDAPIELKEGATTGGLDVVLTTRTTEVTGSIALPASGRRQASVIVFPADSSRWGPQSRFIQVRRPNASGEFRMHGLPPGDYLAIAVPYVWQGEWSDADFLDRARPAATPFSLRTAETKTLRLNVTPVP